MLQGWRNSALQQHSELQTALHSGVPLNEVLAQASVLMRKVALATMPREKAASVQHDSWLQLLDELGDTGRYTQGVGRLLLTHPYQRDSEVDRDQVIELMGLIQQTIKSAPEVQAGV